MIGSDFVKQIVSRTCTCGECGKKILKGAETLASIKDGRVRKRVCSEECRLEFDAKFWDGVAVKNLTRMGIAR